MEAEFWLERWRRGQTGFHETAPNPALERHWDSLQLRRDARVFVPLAGKSVDMIWLANRGHRVVGIELSEIAVDSFRDEHGAQPNVDLRCGDFFALTRDSLGPVDAVFDRASLIALPGPMRAAYARQMTQLTAPGVRTLLITLEYDQASMSGPPYSVLRSEVDRIYADAHAIESLQCEDVLAQSPKFVQRGVQHLVEAVYRLTRI